MMAGDLQGASPYGNCYAAAIITASGPGSLGGKRPGMAFADFRPDMGPAIALRLRQHLTLTPQVQQALRLLQMSAMEFAQEMEQALAANPFLEENPDAPPPRATPRSKKWSLPQEGSAMAPPSEREQDDWGGVRRAADAVGAPARAAAHVARATATARSPRW